MNIDDLLAKYFEGETSAEEERTLRRFFSEGDVPEELAVYKPLFGYFDQEIERSETKKVIPLRNVKHRFYWLSAIAACLLTAFMVGKYYFAAQDSYPCSGNYVIINGQCYSDPEKVRSMALVALQEVSTTPDEYLPAISDLSDEKVFENQLKELGNILGDEE